MKSRFPLVLALLSAATFAQPNKPAPTVAGSINWIFGVEAREFIAAADAMPEDKWSFIPQTGDFQGVRTFAGQVWHVACANEGFAAELEGQKPPEHCEALGPGPQDNASKDKLMAYLRLNFERMQRDIDALTPANMLEEIDTMYPGGRRTRLAIAATAVYHAADHFGQIVEYLRLNGIVPPSSRPRQQADATPPAAGAPQKVRISAAVAESLLRTRVDAIYPNMARLAHIEGNVILQATIDNTGTVQNMRVVSGHPMLVQAALDAVRQWKYQPYSLNGQPVEAETTITVHFKM